MSSNSSRAAASAESIVRGFNWGFRGLGVRGVRGLGSRDLVVQGLGFRDEGFCIGPLSGSRERNVRAWIIANSVPHNHQGNIAQTLSWH